MTGAGVPLVEGSRLRLRPMRRGDVPALFALQADPLGMASCTELTARGYAATPTG